MRFIRFKVALSRPDNRQISVIVSLNSRDAKQLNRIADLAFNGDTDWLLMIPETSCLTDEEVKRIVEIATTQGASVLSFLLAGGPHLTHRSDAPVPFLGDYQWQPRDAEWGRESGQLFISAESESTFEDSGLSCADAVLLSREAWLQVGRFDEAFGSHFSDLDWFIRAYRTGITCKRLLARIFSVDISSIPPVGNVDSNCLSSMFLLAVKHRVPFGFLRLLGVRIARALALKKSKVRFWADYGIPVDLWRRTFWFANGLFPLRTFRALACELRAATSALSKVRW